MGGQRYPASVREDAIRLYSTEQLSAAAVARRLKLKVFTVKEWVAAAGAIRTMSDAAALACVRSRRGVAVRVAVINRKTGETEIADSALEAARMEMLNADDEVARWSRCRDRLPYFDAAGRKRLYVPDIDVMMKNGSRKVEEVKASTFLHKRDNPEKAAAARAHYANIGVCYVIVTEKEVPKRLVTDARARRASAADLARIKSERRRAWRLARTPEQKAAQAKYMHDFEKLRRERETPEQRELRLEAGRPRSRQRYYDVIASETEGERAARLAAHAKSEARRRERLKKIETDEDRAERKAAQTTYSKRAYEKRLRRQRNEHSDRLPRDQKGLKIMADKYHTTRTLEIIMGGASLEIEARLEFTVQPYVPAQGPSYASGGQPAEGGGVEEIWCKGARWIKSADDAPPPELPDWLSEWVVANVDGADLYAEALEYDKGEEEAEADRARERIRDEGY